MQIRKKGAGLLALALGFALVASACGSNGEGGASPSAAGGSPSSSASGKTETVTLKAYTTSGSEKEALDQLNQKFSEENPNIKIELEVAPEDQYSTVIKTRLAAGDAPDLFTVWPGKKKDPFASAGYLLDLSGESWVSRLPDSAKSVASYDGKVYGMPADQHVIGVIYNKALFKELNLEIPKTWEQFLDTAKKIKDAGKILLAVGFKDLWITQLIAYPMIANSIYANTPDFDRQMYDGKATFADSAWKQTMEDYVALKEYFNDGLMGTTYDQTAQLIASGQAAMVVNGSFMIPNLRALKEDLDLGMFPLPYTDGSKEAWISVGPGAFWAVNAKTAYPEEAKTYLEFMSRPENNRIWLNGKKAFPVFTDASVELDPALKDMEPYMSGGTYPFLDINWPAGVQDTLFTEIQSVFSGGESIDGMLKKLDEAFQRNKDKV
ncbi:MULTISPECIES: ABC transporter substrate-binding protein [Cohnella]|uniref:ABC transporter substrate-binding protein n=1 Tax=Cohnella TaxID=329857 RepID=UPI0009BA65FF|nr:MULTISPECIES: extracellular solute-binding protein [Cohnella]MBN2982889.1 extracellular solute-binding protein [Cohnella algarum]